MTLIWSFGGSLAGARLMFAAKFVDSPEASALCPLFANLSGQSTQCWWACTLVSRIVLANCIQIPDELSTSWQRRNRPCNATAAEIAPKAYMSFKKTYSSCKISLLATGVAKAAVKLMLRFSCRTYKILAWLSIQLESLEIVGTKEGRFLLREDMKGNYFTYVSMR